MRISAKKMWEPQKIREGRSLLPFNLRQMVQRSLLLNSTVRLRSWTRKPVNSRNSIILLKHPTERAIQSPNSQFQKTENILPYVTLIELFVFSKKRTCQQTLPTPSQLNGNSLVRLFLMKSKSVILLSDMTLMKRVLSSRDSSQLERIADFSNMMYIILSPIPSLSLLVSSRSSQRLSHLPVSGTLRKIPRRVFF